MLEIIFVLAFLGILLLAVGKYVRKLIDERHRQATADAVAQEVYGVLQFVNTDTIETVNNGSRERVTNPLYQTSDTAVYPDAKKGSQAALKGLADNPVWLSHPNATKASLDATQGSTSPYIARNYSTSLTSPISNSMMISIGGNTYYSHSLKWSQAIWGQDSVRGYFTDSVCQGGNAGVSNIVYFNQQFLSCSENPVFRNSEIAVSRIDLINDKGSFSSGKRFTGINRVDVYISFTSVDNNPARIEQFITPLMTAFKLKKIMPNTSGIYLVRKLNFSNDNNAFTLLDKTSGQPAVVTTPSNHLALFSDLPYMTDKLEAGRTYAIRFSFDGKGDYLRADGLNSADKICWNTITGAGPCLISSAQDTLVLKRRDKPNEFANLQAGDVVSVISDKGVVTKKYYNTAPRIQYKAFSNVGVATPVGPYYRDSGGNLCNVDNNCTGNSVSTEQIADPVNGAISMTIQDCPVVNGWSDGRADTDPDKSKLYPRLSATVSSVISGLTKNPTDGHLIDAPRGIFGKQSDNLIELSRPNSNTSVNRLGGVVFQVSQVDKTWRIGALVATEDMLNSGRAWQYYNPPWLSLMVTTWCSSEPQP
ncbi:hypothetical protein G6O06_004187 [Salmonella enterica subsp. enterica]|uniref:hypothetical protein n=1 Tax=Salmonella enterica TaxID=28901 RepID=UPI0003BD8151|nr:hypothetical protein [Salmonella enterica]EBY9433383.1 hypothetical protein [Salmonella enterica subsp. enterica serovar Cerro]ESG76343.1 putative pilus biosynthesis protein [Salmonella enterica subsp. enterica serovar Muenchen str. baa1594]EBI1927246.1 hypothetical protein [Salmonella enterica]EEO3522724.1 hypothetical protein [Salmonella enterica subsp. enterica serovar Cerro]